MKNLRKLLFILAGISLFSCVTENDLDQPAVDDEIVSTDDDGGIDDPLSSLNVAASITSNPCDIK